MGKLTIKQGLKLVEDKIITKEAYDAMVARGEVSEGRSGGVVRVLPGTTISPQLYFKGAKGVDKSEAVKAVIAELRGKVNDLIVEYTQIADGDERTVEAAEPTEPAQDVEPE